MQNNTRESVKDIKRFYMPELDGLRFFAFFLVFLHHHKLIADIPILKVIHTKGSIGVDLFFALSAFLFTKLLIAEFEKNKKIDFKKFYLRRIFRIWPLYFLLIGISLAIVLLKGEFTKYILARIIGLLAFSDNFMSVFYSNYVKMPYISHLWTITYEEQFYIFVPFLILLLIRFSARTKFLTLLFTLALFNLIRLIFIQHNVPFKTIWVLPITNFESIILGIVMGFGGYDILLKRFKPVQIFIISIGFFLLLNFIPPRTIVSNWLILSYLFTALFSTLLIFSVVHSQQLKSFFSKHIFVYLGKRSYGLYMYHLLGNGVASLLIKKVSFMPSNLLASFLYSISFTIIVSIISYKYFETPFLKLKKRFEVIISRPI